MNLFVNYQNLNHLNSYFLQRCGKLLFKGFLRREIITLNIRLDTETELFPSFRFFLSKMPDFLKFIHFLEKHTGVRLRIKLSDIPYCVFLPPQTRVEHLIQNDSDSKKIKLNCCRGCKYDSLCGGIPKNYLKKYGDSEFKKISDLPYQIMIEVEPRCNLNCSWCFNRNTFAKNDRLALISLKTPTIKEIIEEIAKLKIPTIRFTGGEPLLRDDIFELLGYAKNKGLHVILNSNGILIDETNARKLNGLVDTVLISIQGVGQKGDNAVGKKGAFQSKINAIFNLKRFTKPQIYVSTILRPEIMEENSEMDKIYNLIKEIGGISRWHLCRCIPENKESYKKSGENYKRIINKLAGWQLGKSALFFYHYPFVISNGIPFCFYDAEIIDLMSYGGLFIDGHNRLSIDPTGRIKPIYYSPVVLSNEPADIVGAWNHPFIKDLKNFKSLPDECITCFYKRKCLGGNRFVANLIYGSYSAPDPLMPVKEARYFMPPAIK